MDFLLRSSASIGQWDEAGKMKKTTRNLFIKWKTNHLHNGAPNSCTLFLSFIIRLAMPQMLQYIQRLVWLNSSKTIYTIIISSLIFQVVPTFRVLNLIARAISLPETCNKRDCERFAISVGKKKVITSNTLVCSQEKKRT